MWAATLNISAILIIFTITNAAGLKIVPTDKTTTHKNGVTHERTKYVVVPDDPTSTNIRKTNTNIKSHAYKSTQIDQENNKLQESRKKTNVEYIRMKNLDEPLKDAISKLKSISDIHARKGSQESFIGSPSNDLARSQKLADETGTAQKDESSSLDVGAEQFAKKYEYRKLPGGLRFSTEYLNGLSTPEAELAVTSYIFDPEAEKFDNFFIRNGVKETNVYNGLDYTWEPEKLMKDSKIRYSSDYLDYGRADVDDLNANDQAYYNVAGKYENRYSNAAVSKFGGEKIIGGYDTVPVIYPPIVNRLCVGPVYNLRDCVIPNTNQYIYDKQVKNSIAAKSRYDKRITDIAYQPAVNEVIINGNPIVPIVTEYPPVDIYNGKTSDQSFNYNNYDRYLNYAVPRQPPVQTSYLPSGGLINQYYGNTNNAYDYLQTINAYKSLNLNPVLPGYDVTNPVVPAPVVPIPSVPIYNNQISNDYRNLIKQKTNKIIVDRNNALYNNYNNLQIKYDNEYNTDTRYNKIAVNLQDSIFVRDIIHFLHRFVEQQYGVKIHYENYNLLNVFEQSRYEMELKYNLKSLREFLTKVIVLRRADTVENVDLLYDNIVKFIYYLDTMGISESQVYKLIEVIKKRILTIVQVVSYKNMSNRTFWYTVNNYGK